MVTWCTDQHTRQLSLTPINSALVPLVPHYRDNWGVHHAAAQRLVNIFTAFSNNSLITKQQWKSPSPNFLSHFKCNWAVSNLDGV